MKQLLLILFTIVVIPAIAQQNEGQNILKVNASAFTVKGFHVQYERKVAPRITVALGYGMIPKGRIAWQRTLENYIDNPNVQFGDARLGTSVITPEVRFYTGKKGAFHGFYIAPYARFSMYNMGVPINYTNGNEKRNAVFNGKLNTITGGLMLGSQFTLSNTLYLDWWIIGAGIGGAKGDMVTITPLTPSEQQSLRNQLESIKVPFTDIKYNVNSTGATVQTTGGMLGVRGFGLSLGFRF